jgi:hypothetical protein
MSRTIDTAEVAKIIRTELKKNFPGIKFSVKSSRYSGGSSINVKYSDGPALDAVKSVIGHFHGASFDGMQDLKEYHVSEYNGEAVRFGNDFLFIDREYSRAFCEGVKAHMLAEMAGFYVTEQYNESGFQNDGYINIVGSDNFGYRCDCMGNSERWRIGRLMSETSAEQAAAWLNPPAPTTPAPTEPTATPVAETVTEEAPAIVTALDAGAIIVEPIAVTLAEAELKARGFEMITDVAGHDCLSCIHCRAKVVNYNSPEWPYEQYRDEFLATHAEWCGRRPTPMGPAEIDQKRRENPMQTWAEVEAAFGPMTEGYQHPSPGGI